MPSSTFLYPELHENLCSQLFIVVDASAAFRGLSRHCMSSIKDKYEPHTAKEYRALMSNSACVLQRLWTES